MGQKFEGALLAGVDPVQLERVLVLLRERLPDVFKANRFFEEQTGFHNEAGTNNLVDALSHFSTLIENAEELGPIGQAEQVAMLEDHLRRSMMEAFEQLLKFRLAEVAQLWERHLVEVEPLLARRDGLPEATTSAELLAKREQIAKLMDIGWRSKRMIDWSDWEEGTGALAEACDLTAELQFELEAGLAAAARDTRIRRQHFLVGCLLLLALGVGILVGALLL